MLSEVINVPMTHNVIRFKDEIIPIQVNSVEYTNAGPKVHNIFDQDEFIRPDHDGGTSQITYSI